MSVRDDRSPDSPTASHGSTGGLGSRGRALLRELRALTADRARVEEETTRTLRELTGGADRDRDDRLEHARTRLETESSAIAAERADRTARVRDGAVKRRERIEASAASERERLAAKAAANMQVAKKKWDEAVWLAETVYEAGEDRPDEEHALQSKIIVDRRTELVRLREEAEEALRRSRFRAMVNETDADKPADPASAPASAPAPAPDTDPESDPDKRLETSCETARTALEQLSGLRSARIFRGWFLPVEITFVVAVTFGVAMWLRAWAVDGVVLGAAGGALGVCLALAGALYLVARRRARDLHHRIVHAGVTGDRAADEALAAADARREREQRTMLEGRDREVREANELYEPILAEITQRRDAHLERITRERTEARTKLDRRERRELASIEESCVERLALAQEEHDESLRSIRSDWEERTRDARTSHEKAWSALDRDWRSGMTRCGAALASIRDDDTRLFPERDEAAWDAWTPPHEFAPSIRFGAIAVDRAVLPGGLPDDERLRTDVPITFELPAALDLPDRAALLLLAREDGRATSIDVLRSVMFRLLTSLPPAKVRLTIVDPVGLGRNFAGFMHLADFEESLVDGRIWTESRHIEQRLADLTEHMETVIQKYLRNEFETIADYNEEAGEIAEPYRFLVVADFPANFSETATRRLASIVSSGARCGVFTLIAADLRQPILPGLDLADLRANALTIEWKDGRPVVDNDDLRDLPLTLDPPPVEDVVTRALHTVGAAAGDASRVEVPFTAVAPADDLIWSGDCTRRLSVPLGRSGATKLQNLEIGEGTAQHALIAGKTGSGKSTLLHVLISNLALWYGPDEVEFYLIDFKKGVEFKTYARHALPHVRAVAIESDREFGVSVLQRLDTELRMRGEKFRAIGVQDLAGYRRAAPDDPMPRTLLVIDEFQELFVEDDKVGQEAALLMDRLVRQGRAFGLHVLLGSQTLGGAYSLARSTIGQMQVRIALQCTEADSYLILSEDNAAARLLARPGEAIYNDAGGAIAGNSPFQIVWLPDAERDAQLARVAAAAERTPPRRRVPETIVFEGNVPADASRCRLLAVASAHDRSPDRPSGTAPDAPTAWIGEAIAIKGPTAAVFGRRGGRNLLIAGQQDEPALAMQLVALLSLAAQVAPEPARTQFIVLDGTPTDAPEAGRLEHVLGLLPHGSRHATWRETDAVMTDLAAELARRHEHDGPALPPLFVFIHALQRFRTLRTSDEFGFSMGENDGPPKPDRIFGDVLRDGPPLGMHVLTWCDSLTNLNRTLERGALREFEMRVLFQMSATDSTQLIDVPLAGSLGLHRALFHDEESGNTEKFRPWALPADDWMQTFAARLRNTPARS